ncbi:Not1-domain-containing protein [Coemansia reversa NRRL 1564]|uniref:General negative regulator of transcription subunit 1 n=1 Tax=Coemansia reversa (strain ATCC 12441 / NRRL 1564) TaxID=763665 RepID=A0A2G5B9E0_COERN|nr:Not1-domain-containing protein [Coemansia reversa NRRL 1564]|eukprot:PIA15624.1 Not1-domain-containing protein [Coemansia reversa NRRL 1564]
MLAFVFYTLHYDYTLEAFCTQHTDSDSACDRKSIDSSTATSIFKLVSTLCAKNFETSAQQISEASIFTQLYKKDKLALLCCMLIELLAKLVQHKGHSVIVWHLRSLFLVHALLSCPDTKHFVAADFETIEAVIEGTLASVANSATASALVLQAVGTLYESSIECISGVDIAFIRQHCVEHVARFLCKDYWASLAVISSLAKTDSVQTLQQEKTSLLSLLFRLPKEKQGASASKDQILPFAIANLAVTSGSPLSSNFAGITALSSMGLAEQFIQTGSHVSALDIIAKYTQQQQRHERQSTDNNGTGKVNAGDGQNNQATLFTVDDVSRAIALIASNTSEEEGWKADEFAAGITKYCPSLSWEDVIYRLPYSNLNVKHEQGAAFVINAFLTATAGQNRTFPYSFMYEIWPDASAQVAFLRSALRCSSVSAHLLDKHMPAISADPLDTLYRVYHPEFTRMIASPWNSLSLILVLSHLLDSKASEDARALMETGILREPVLVTLALARLKIQHPRLQALLQQNVARFLKREFGHNGLFFELFRIFEKKMMLAFFCNLHRKDSSFTRHILDALVDLGMASDMLLIPRREDIMMLDFTVELAVFASRRGLVAFETWFPGLLAELGSDMLHASLEILHSKLQVEAARQRGEDQGAAAYTSTELTTIFKALGVMAMSPNNAANLKALYAQFVELVAELERAESEHSADEGRIEKEAEGLFLQLYRGELSVDQMADMLEGLRDSLKIHKRKTFAHVVQYPLEEFSFFDNYPDKELTVTGQLVGVLIQRHMLSPASEPDILDMLIKALHQPQTSKSFHFGMTALQTCQSRMEQLPVFCTTIFQIPGFCQDSNAPVVKLIQSIIGSALPTRGTKTGSTVGASLSGATPVPGVDSTGEVAFDHTGGLVGASLGRPMFQSVNPSPLPLLGEPFSEPSEDTKDKIQFAVNNLARSNLRDKTSEVDKVLQPTHFTWFSQEIVVKRASQEPNYHSLYLLFVEALARPLLTKCILRETLVSIARLLNAESTISSSRDRSYLKNLGAWLGGITLAQNQPILRENVSFKDLLCEGYAGNRLIVAIPFVCKVLEQAARSTIFHPPNPWLMGIMGVLSELYVTASLKLNLTFEIEVLCKALGLDVKEIPPTAVLRSRPAHRAMETLTTELAKATIGGDGVGAAAGADGIASPPGAGAVQVPVISGTDITVDILSVLSQHASFHAADALFSQQPTMKKMFYMLTERMIREIIPIHVARSIYVAVSCTRDTILKDFCGEPNEEHVHRAAQVMARGLAGALAVSLCREQLKSKLYLTMREFLIGHSLPEQSANTVAVGLVADNLDLACAIAEKEAIERASLQIDSLLSDSYVARKRTRERTGQPYYDMARFGRLTYPAGFPELLKVRLNGLQPGHLRIYEDFTQIPHFFSQINSGAQGASDTSSALGHGRSTVDGGVSAVAPVDLATTAASEGAAKFSAAQCFERFAVIIGDLDKIVANVGPGVLLSQLPSQHEACLYARDILILAARSASPDDTAMDFAQALVNYLYRSETRLGVELYVLLLARMCEMSGRVAKEVTSWLAFADDERKFNVPATIALINEGLVSVDDEDEQLGRLIKANRPAAIDFAARLLRKGLIDGALSSGIRSFAKTIQGFMKLAQSGRAPQSVAQLLEDIQDLQQQQPPPIVNGEARPSSGATGRLNETASYQNILYNWTRVYDHPAAGEAELTTLVQQLLQQVPLHVTGVKAAFFRACVEAALSFYDQSAALGRTALGGAACYQVADALVKLVVYLTKLGERGDLKPVRMFLSSVVLVIVHTHATSPDVFGAYQKPFFRLLCGLLSEAHAARRDADAWCTREVFRGIIELLGEALQLLTPARVPGFSFVWLMLVSHRFFFPCLAEDRASWPLAAGLLESQLQFLEPFTVTGQITESLKLLYRGVICVILVVLHDYPEFLASYALQLCDAVPSNCVQLRNLLLSAYPRDMRLPEPLTPNLKIDLLADISRSPDIPFDHAAPLEPTHLRAELESFIHTQQPTGFEASVIDKLRTISSPETTLQTEGKQDVVHYSVAATNALVLHAAVVITCIEDEVEREAAQRTALGLFQSILAEADAECRYLVVNGMANQLRFPSSHTYLYSRVILALFSKCGEDVRECIARVLIERILVNRPFPWGLLVTLIELLRNPFYAFWSHEFTRISPQIAEILSAVAKSIHATETQSQADSVVGHGHQPQSS